MHIKITLNREPPTHRFSVRCCENVTPEKTKSYKTPKGALTPKSTPDPRKHVKSELPKELLAINRAWATLPEYIKKTILTLINVSKK
jgi:hypothetical protein